MDEPSDDVTGSVPGSSDPAPEARQAYYRELAADYETKIRQLVPHYEDVLDRLSELAALGEPSSILDVGCGTGELTGWIARRAPEARVVALEVASEMASIARDQLTELADRVQILERDVLDVEPGGPDLPVGAFDVVHTNFVLHNLPWEEKRRAVAQAHSLLAKGGTLVWGDLIRFEDPALQRSQVERRIQYARAAGCSEELIRWNFRKEAEEDFPLTARETLELLRRVGFPDPEVVWARETFLAVRARTG